MALDAYMQIEGIKGESADSGHKDWIEVSNVAWSVFQPRAEAVSTAGGMTTGRAVLSNLSFKKLADLSSPVLQQHCAMGKTIPRAKFEFMRADGDGKPICYYTVDRKRDDLGGQPNQRRFGHRYRTRLSRVRQDEVEVYKARNPWWHRRKFLWRLGLRYEQVRLRQSRHGIRRQPSQA